MEKRVGMYTFRGIVSGSADFSSENECDCTLVLSWAFPGLLQAVNLYNKDADFSKINVWECRLFVKELVGMQTFREIMSGNVDFS